MRKFFVAAIAAVFLAGCASQETQPEAPIDDKGAATASAGGTTTSTREAGVWEREASRKNRKDGIVIG